MSTNVDYDYDEVIQFCQGEGQNYVNELANSLNSLSGQMETCQDAFHSKDNKLVIGDIYRAFSTIIGSTSANNGLSGLDSEAAKIVNICYSEAMSDKKILESDMLGGADTQSSLDSAVLSGANQGINLAQDANLTSDTVEASTQDANATVTDAQQGTSASNPEASETATTESAPTQETNATPAPEQTPDPAPASAGGSVSGTLSPGTTANTFQAKAYNLSPEEYKTLCATVYAEAAEGNSYTTSDTMGVTSTILNRVEAGNWGGTTVTDVVSAKGQFSGYGSQNAKFAAAMSNPDVISPEMRAAIDRTLAGERNTTGQSFSGNGTHNSFR